MITKELFLKCLDTYKKYNEWEGKLYDLGINFWEQDEVANLLSSYIELLEYCCKDDMYENYDPTNISYFIYDCDYGKKADEYFITEQDGSEVKFYTAEDLWNYLVKNHPEIDDKSEKKKQSDKTLSQDDLMDIFMENFSRG